jgi:hypothetical protein
MKQIFGIFIVGVTLMTTLYGCTENTRARVYGGSQTVTLPAGKRLVNVTWKTGSDLWILTKDDTTTKAGTYHFGEKSQFGIWEGEVIIKEQ